MRVDACSRPDFRVSERRADRKVNDLVALRSSDGGDTWHGPPIAFAIDCTQHGFVPFIPRGGSRLYAFGTQPIWERYRRAQGLQENAPIGYRWSDDDGHAWSDARLIEPDNDPGFTGMSVMRMCETAAGSWLIGAHEADWSHVDLFIDRGTIHMFIPHRWQQVAYLRFPESLLADLPTAAVF